MACRFLLMLALAAAPSGVGAEAPAALTGGVEQALSDIPARYTTHRSRPLRTEVISLQLDGTFAAHERARIAHAVRAWNHVLNGFVRFEVAGAAEGGEGSAQSWLIAPARQPSLRRGIDLTLALTQPVPSGGGAIVLYVNRLGGRDLGAVLLHELGHVLGLNHENDNGGEGGLMSAYYSAHAQSCVDRRTVARIAAGRRLPLEQLNWCQSGPVER